MNTFNSRQTTKGRCLGHKCHALHSAKHSKIKYDWQMENDRPTSFLVNDLPPPRNTKKLSQQLCTVPKFLVKGICTVVQGVTYGACLQYYRGKTSSLNFFLTQLFLAATNIKKEIDQPEDSVEQTDDITFYVCPVGIEYDSVKELEEKCFTKVSPYGSSYFTDDRILYTSVQAKDIETKMNDPKDFLKMMAYKYQEFVLVPVDLNNDDILPPSPVFTVKKRGKEVVFCKE